MNQKPEKRNKAEHRQYLLERKKEETNNAKRRSAETWKEYNKALSVKSGDIIFSAKADIFKIWGISVLCFSVMVIIVYVVSLMNEQQLIFEFGSLLNGRMFQIGISLFSSILFISIVYFLHNKYVIEITLLDDNALKIKTWGLLGYKENTYTKNAWVEPPKFREGKTNATPYSPSVHAPYLSLSPNGGKKKLIISDYGNFPFGTKVLDNIISPFY